MDSDQHIETEKTENEEKPQHLSYRYENAKDNEFHPKQYNINSIEVSESGDIMKKINEAADNLESIIDKNDLKIFSKYEDLNIEQLQKLLNEKTQNILKLNNQKEDSKKVLSNLLKQLNKTITENAEILYKEKPDMDRLFDLQKEMENKKKELKLVKKINHSCKSQYNTINNKLNNKKEDNSDNNGEVKINNLKNENKKLQFDIRKYKDETVTKTKDVKNIVDNKLFPNLMKKRTDEIRNLTNSKHKCYTKMQITINSLENLIKEINHLEESTIQKYKEDEDEILNNKLNFWIDIIKSDLAGTKDEIISRIDKNETNFLKEINKVDSNNASNNSKAKSSSFDENKKENNYNIAKSYNLYSSHKKNNVVTTSHKGIFGKFNYLKQKPNSSINKNKLNNINISSEEIKINNYKKTNNNIDIDSIIQKDYEETTDNEYRQLLDKKSQYLETNVRLEKNIKEIEKTKKSKILNISCTVEENEQKLKDLKAQNDLLEQEIMNLQNLYQLTIDKEKLKLEIKEREKKNKKLTIEENNINKDSLNGKTKLETSLTTEKTLLNELKESNDSVKKNKTKNGEKHKMNKNENRSGYVDDYIPDKVGIETREQRLEKIKKKYLDENQNEQINENENKSTDEKNNLDNNENKNEVENIS
jgi:hypothetical protein